MGDFKKIIILSGFFLFIGVGFSNGVFFKKNTVVEEIVEYDEVIKKVKRVKVYKREPAARESLTIDDSSSESLVDRNTILEDQKTSVEDEYAEEAVSNPVSGGGQGYSSSLPSQITLSGSRSYSDEGSEYTPSTHSTQKGETKAGSSVPAGGFMISNVTAPPV